MFWGVLGWPGMFWGVWGVFRCVLRCFEVLWGVLGVCSGGDGSKAAGLRQGGAITKGRGSHIGMRIRKINNE